ncbi:RDD family protein [Rhizomonospora bruguierae]|uniref:RDD family protein n=1 Tax=Rhizomonospora bruguierae TaxID=1581705 RepID=UPI0020BFDF61|nr:RDD family protein [Micromonospora sp. NBRC 107566]
MTVTAQLAPPAPAEPAEPAPAARVVSGEAVEVEVRVARVGSRALALLVDAIVQVALLLLLVPATLITSAIVFDGFEDAALVQALLLVCVLVSFAGYPLLLETLTGGRSLGKLAMGLRVVREDGGPIQFRHALTRMLIGLALEWPGLMLLPLTWLASLGTMLLNPRGRRLGDLAAGTLVIHERTPASWGWVPTMPPALAGWAATLDLTGLEDDLALAVRHFLSRGRLLVEPERTLLGRALAIEVAGCTAPGPPPGVPGWAYLAAVLAERHRRAAARLARSRSVTAALWPDLMLGPVGAPPPPYPAWAPPVTLPAGPPPLRHAAPLPAQVPAPPPTYSNSARPR